MDDFLGEERDLMGKITGFLEIERLERGYEPAADRVRHFKEFVLDPGEAEIMETLESEILADLGYPDPYAAEKQTQAVS